MDVLVFISLLMVFAGFGYYLWQTAVLRNRWDHLRRVIQEEGDHIPDHLFDTPEDDPERQLWRRQRRAWSISLLNHMDSVEAGRARLTR